MDGNNIVAVIFLIILFFALGTIIWGWTHIQDWSTHATVHKANLHPDPKAESMHENRLTRRYAREAREEAKRYQRMKKDGESGIEVETEVTVTHEDAAHAV
ncbi:hypothetical protein EG329_005170 [Mollisiaceae sp. DMI_Dod_QoI]|nr:hypothetical protein EG329_005170 [Helotiales sp. DMI_Dod_QoI]